MSDYCLLSQEDDGVHKLSPGRPFAQHSLALFLRFVRSENKWHETNRVTSRIGNLQPSVVQIDDNHLIAYSRRGGGYGPLADGFIVRSESRDGGWTWSLINENN